MFIRRQYVPPSEMTAHAAASSINSPAAQATLVLPLLLQFRQCRERIRGWPPAGLDLLAPRGLDMGRSGGRVGTTRVNEEHAEPDYDFAVRAPSILRILRGIRGDSQSTPVLRIYPVSKPEISLQHLGSYDR
jgi:hypothetical protein